jgi:hypothetical protein
LLPKGAKAELSTASHGELEAMRWVTTHPPAEDFTYEQRSAREFKETSPAAFYQRKAKLEEAEPATKPPQVPRGHVKPTWNGPGPCSVCKTVIERRDTPAGSLAQEITNFTGTTIGVKYFLEEPRAVDVNDELKAKGTIALALCRLPMDDAFDFFDLAVIVLAGDGQSKWLSANLLNGKHVVVLDRALLNRPQEEKVAEILMQVARVLVKARHPLEYPRELVADISLCFCQTCGEHHGETPEYKRQVEAFRRGLAAYEVQVKDGEATASKLVAKWQEAWRDPKTRPTRSPAKHSEGADSTLTAGGPPSDPGPPGG